MQEGENLYVINLLSKHLILFLDNLSFRSGTSLECFFHAYFKSDFTAQLLLAAIETCNSENEQL